MFKQEDVINHKKCKQPLSVLWIKKDCKEYYLTRWRWCDTCGIMVKIDVSQIDVQEATLLVWNHHESSKGVCRIEMVVTAIIIIFRYSYCYYFFLNTIGNIEGKHLWWMDCVNVFHWFISNVVWYNSTCFITPNIKWKITKSIEDRICGWIIYWQHYIS